MEDSNTTASATPPPALPPRLGTAKDPTRHHNRHHLFHSISQNHQNTNTLSLNSIILIISIISIVVASAIFLIIVMLRRLKSVRKHGNCKESSGISINKATSRFIAHTTIDFNYSPGNYTRFKNTHVINLLNIQFQSTNF